MGISRPLSFAQYQLQPHISNKHSLIHDSQIFDLQPRLDWYNYSIHDSIEMSSEPSPTPPDEALPDEPADMPLTMAASVVLEQVPKDAHSALEHASELAQAKSNRYQPFHDPSSFLP